MAASKELAERVGHELSKLSGVQAVALGGSMARGTAHQDSDIDLGIYYFPERPFPVEELASVARRLDDRHEPNLVTRLGEWGPWINGGGWLVIDGCHIDFLYRDLDKVADVVARCAAGRITCDYQIGHPAGFHNHIYMGEAHHCRVLHDRTGVLRTLKALTAEYPPLMRKALIEKYLYEASFSLAIAGKPADRGDIYYVSGCLFRAVGCVVQVLYALNRRYFVNEKDSIREAGSFPIAPSGFDAQVSAIFGGIRAEAGPLQASVERCGGLVQAAAELCAGN